MTEALNAYERNGYQDRQDYLRAQSENYGVSLEKVMLLADLLGPEEDFDGLISQLDELEGEEE